MKPVKKVIKKKIIKKKTIKKKVIKPKIIIYGEKWCPFCRNAKELSTKVTKSVKFISGKSGTQLRKILKLTNVPRTIPQIVVNGKHIGGFSNLQKIYK